VPILHTTGLKMVLLALLGMTGPVAVSAGTAEEVTAGGQSFAYLVIDSNEVHLGVPFEVVLLVEAAQGTVKADFSTLKDFSTRYVSARSGPAARGARYELHYSFVARRSGKLALPAIEVAVGQQILKTQAVELWVLEPEQTDALGLDISLSKARCYLGEAIELNVIWRVELDLSLVKGVDLHIPILNDPRFQVFDPAQAIDMSTKGAVGLPVESRRVIALASTQQQGENAYSTLTFTKVLVPRATGTLEIDRGSVYCAVTTGTTEDKPKQYPSYFDNDFFKRDINAKYKRCYALSEHLRLEVKALPEAGRPAGFCGLVSAGLTLGVSASPLQVPVGAPVTLEVCMQARDFVEHLELRPLHEQATLISDFAIAQQRPLFVYDRGAKLFTQSLRPLRMDIESIGPIAVPYFDTDLGEYVVARSEPYAIEVLDAGASAEASFTRQREAAADTALLATHAIAIAVVFVVGVGVGMGLFAGLARKRRIAKHRAPHTNAYAAFKRTLVDIPDAEGGTPKVHERVYTALRSYLGAKLGITPHTLACNDALRRLESMGIDASVLRKLAQLFSECEVYRFGKCYTNNNALESDELRESADTCIEDIDRHLNALSS
jgi:hypothetical protein